MSSGLLIIPRSPLTINWILTLCPHRCLQVLLALLSVKMPITDADLIRSMACKALVGLSRCSAIRQIISKLPLFSSGHIQQVESPYR